MASPAPGKADRALIQELVQHASESEKTFSNLLQGLSNTFSADQELMLHVHSMKWRVKNPEHLRDKLIRKWIEAQQKGRAFAITPGNLFTRINDLAGFRILHLHMRQFEKINECLQRIFGEQLYRIIEGPSARTWDDESRTYFSSINTATVRSASLYTSVHYVIAPNQRTKYTCELQVRSLAEELWGEVEHAINYPHPSQSLACREQLKVLARVTSSCSRLVDSIFLSHMDHMQLSKRKSR